MWQMWYRWSKNKTLLLLLMCLQCFCTIPLPDYSLGEIWIAMGKGPHYLPKVTKPLCKSQTNAGPYDSEKWMETKREPTPAKREKKNKRERKKYEKSLPFISTLVTVNFYNGIKLCLVIFFLNTCHYIPIAILKLTWHNIL